MRAKGIQLDVSNSLTPDAASSLARSPATGCFSIPHGSAKNPSRATELTKRTKLNLFALAFVLLFCCMTTSCFAQVDEGQEEATDQSLLDSQRQTSERYRRFEETLLRMAELNASTNPRRAALLRQVIAESRDRLLDARFMELVELLEDQRYAKALENQENLQRDLVSLLTLLLSEDRAKRLAEEKARLKAYLKQVQRIAREQKDLRRRTERSEDAEQLAEKQDRLADDTGALERDMKNASGGSPSEGSPSGEKSSEKSSEGSPSQGGEAEKGESGEGQSGEGKSGEPGSSGQDGQPSQSGQQGESGQEGPSGEESQEQDDAQPGLHSTKSIQERLEAAKRRMQKAREELEKAKHEGAVEQQEEAIRELELAQAELEEILRQLREEEMERVLMALEERLKRMLQLQKAVYEGTRQLDKIPAEKRTSRHEIDAGQLSNRESLIVRQADQAMLLLKEDGTVVAMPEALDQAREDMRQVVTRLARADVGAITLATEEEILVALEEMLAAVRKEMDNMEKRKSGQSQQQGTMDQPLVDQLAELRMIRSMEIRVKRRTVSLDQLGSTPDVDPADLQESHRELARRQQRIYEITQDIASGKNQ